MSRRTKSGIAMIASRHYLYLTTARLGCLAALRTVRWPTSRSNRPSYNSFAEEVVQAAELDGVRSLVRQPDSGLGQECPELCRQQRGDGLAGDGLEIDHPGGGLDVLVWYMAQFNAVAHGISYLDGLRRVLLRNRPRS